MLVDDYGNERYLTDSFMIRYWHVETIFLIAHRCGLVFDRDLSNEFLGTGSKYFLLRKL